LSSNRRPSPGPPHDLPFLAGGGEMGALMRAHDWSTSPLGSPADWPQALRTAARLLLNCGHPMYIWWGSEGACLYNDAYRLSIGPERHPGSLGRPVREVWGEIWDIIGPQIEQVMAGRGATWHENQLVPITRNGRREDVYWTYSYSPIGDEAALNGVGGVLVICSETTQKVLSLDMEATRALERSESRLRTIFETSFQFQGLLALDGTLVDANATSLEAIRCAPADVIGKRFWETPWFTGTPGLVEAVRDSVARAAKGESLRQELRVNLPVGGWRWFDFALRPVRNSQGVVTAIVPEAMELTERKQAEEALRQSQKLEAMGQLTGGVAHDFNNLLTPIIGGLDMLQRRRVGGEREQRLIDGALQSADRARHLVQRLLAFARRQPLQPIAVDVVTLMAGLEGLIASTSGPQIQVVVDVASDLPPAIADPNQIEMAILNLSVNARDAMPDGGTLTIAARRETVGPGQRPDLAAGSYIRLSVADTGVGMDAPTLARAIEPFFSTKGIGKGTGLGLSMVHGLASQLGGALTIASEKGRGTNVDLWLPVSAAPVSPGAGASADNEGVRSAGTALLVDDEDLVRGSTADMLADFGFDVLQATSAAEALSIIGGGTPVDILVTDHLMPGMTGVDLARSVRSRRPDMPVLIISGFAEAEGIAPELPRLTKPFRQAELAASIATILSADAARLLAQSATSGPG
jgi:PAS domain S-box-containing protein